MRFMISLETSWNSSPMIDALAERLLDELDMDDGAIDLRDQRGA